MQQGIPTTEYFVRLSDLKQPIERNPYDEKEGNISAYMRYLKYNTKMADVRENAHGEWITDTESALAGNVCSACGKVANSIFHKTNFCPNCGADMREV